MITQQADNPDHEPPCDLRFQAIAHSVCARLANNHRVRRNLPGGGRIRIDRQLPFLCVHRKPPQGKDRGTRELITTEASYMFASGKPEYYEGLRHLCHEIVSDMEEHFGAFLLIELWTRDEAADDGQVHFKLVSPSTESLPTTFEKMRTALSVIELEHRPVEVEVQHAEQVAPPGMPPLLGECDAVASGGCCVIGLEINPVYRDRESGALYPILLQSLRRQLAPALRKTIAQFAGSSDDQSSSTFGHHALGPSYLVKAARTVDRELCEVAESYDFLLHVTPTNSSEAWASFQSSGYRRLPPLIYRPLPYRPNVLKRNLFNIEIERIEDPLLAHLFWEKQQEIDRQLSALTDLNTPAFLHSSLQLYGTADEELRSLAEQILYTVNEAEPDGEGGSVGTQTLLDRAMEEITYYRSRMPEFDATVEISDEIASGIMVSRDRLLIARDLSVSEARLEPLIHHEIGTHLLTYFNGQAQQFQQLHAGLAGYDELQEGMAVLAEYLVGGLTVSRMRTLAGRVLAADSVANGSSFAQTFQLLHEQWGFSCSRAFSISLRVHRGGGLTKDVIYLRGLRDLLAYLAAGHDIEPLYVGKIGLHHVPYIQDMRRRNVIVAPRILPRFWDDDSTRAKLEKTRGMSVLQLMETD